LIRSPIPRKNNIEPRVVKMLREGGVVAVFSKMVLPKVYNQNGITPNDNKVLRKVIAMLRLRFPPSKTAHMLLAPPPGLQPKIKRPNLR